MIGGARASRRFLRTAPARGVIGSAASAAIATVALAALPAASFAEVETVRQDGATVVRDIGTGAYWFRDLPAMLDMTKDEQREFIEELNRSGYAGRSNWAFATLAQVTTMMDSMAEGSNRSGDAVVMRWPVAADRYFVATQYIDADAQRDELPVGSHWLYCGRTADELVTREDLIHEPPYYVESEQFGEGQYHFPLFDYFGDQVYTEGVFDTIMYDYDVNYMDDAAVTSPAPRSTDPTSSMPPLQCSAWVVSE